MCIAVPFAAAQPVNDTNQTVPGTNATNLTEDASAFELNETDNVTDQTDDGVTANVSTVIIASTENYPDAFIASTAASKVGAPVLLTENDTVSAGMRATLDRFNPDEVVLTGGPEVLSTDISDELEEQYDVSRLWGFTRYGTAVEVAEYFWPEGADTAVTVQSERQAQDFQSLAASAEMAQDQDAPLYLTPQENVPAITASSMQHLGVDTATVVGVNVTDEYEAQFDDVDVSVAETVTGEDTGQLQEQLRDRVRDQLSDAEQLNVVASDEFQHALVATNAPDATTDYVTQEDDIDPLMEDVDEANIQNATVIGTEELGQSVAVRLGEANISVGTLLGPVDEVIQLNQLFVLQHAEAFEALSADWMEEREQVIQDAEARVQDHVAARLVQTERIMGDDAPEEANTSLERAAQLLQEDEYVESLRETMNARNSIRLQQYQDIVGTAAYDVEIAAELQSLEQFRTQFRSMNPAFGDAFDDAPTGTQLWIIETVRGVSEEETETLVDETASTLEEEEELLSQFERARDRVRTGNLTTNQTDQNQTQINMTNTTTENVTNVTADANDTNATAVNMTNVTEDTNATNATEENMTMEENETVFEENESGQELVASGNQFNFDTRCMPGNVSNNSSVMIGTATENMVRANGSVMLPTPNYNATSAVDVNEDEETVDIHVNFTELAGVGLQCLGEGTFAQDVNVTVGEWNVSVAVAVGNETVEERRETVQVLAENAGNQSEVNETVEMDMTSPNQTEESSAVEEDNATGQTELS